MNNTNKAENNWMNNRCTYKGVYEITFIKQQIKCKYAIQIDFLETGYVGLSSIDKQGLGFENILISKVLNGRRPEDIVNIDIRIENFSDHESLLIEGTLLYGPDLFIKGRSSQPISLICKKAEYKKTTEEKAEYAILPLTNYDFPFRSIKPSHVRNKNHSNLYDLSDDFMQVYNDYNMYMFYKNNYILSNYFIFIQNPGLLIQAIPNHDKNISDLKLRIYQRLITSVLIQKRVESDFIFDKDTRIQNIEKLLLLLSLSDGKEIGSPWIEYHDKNGELIERNHFTNYMPFYSEQLPVIGNSLSNNNLGPSNLELLIECMSRFDESLKIAIKNIITINDFSLPKEFIFQRLFISLDAIFKSMKFPKVKTEINVVQLNNKCKKLEKYICSSRNNNLDSNLEQLGNGCKAIADELLIGYKEKFKSLLEDLKFQDVKVLDPFFYNYFNIQNKKLEKKGYLGYITYQRNRVVHDGSLDIPNKKLASEIEIHLKDLLTRIILKKLGYKGLYFPRIKTSISLKPLDWINQNTSYEDLGFTKNP